MRRKMEADNFEPGTPESWDVCVSRLIGPRMPGEPKDDKQRQALQLAAAALRYAGEHVLAANLLDE